MQQKKIAILISGRGSNFQAIHNSIKSGFITNAEIICVISNRNNAKGLEYANKFNIPTHIVSKKEFPSVEEHDLQIISILEKYNTDLVCLAGYMRILGKRLTDRYYGKIINIHPSLLPSFPGIDAQKQAMDYGVKVSGSTVHFVDSGVDTGPIIFQSYVSIENNDTIESLSDKILIQEHIIYPKAVKYFIENRLKIRGRKVEIIE